MESTSVMYENRQDPEWCAAGKVSVRSSSEAELTNLMAVWENVEENKQVRMPTHFQQGQPVTYGTWRRKQVWGNKGHSGLSFRCLWRHMLMGNALGKCLPLLSGVCAYVHACTVCLLREHEWVRVYGAQELMLASLQWLPTCLQKNFKTRSLMGPEAHQLCPLARGTLLSWACATVGSFSSFSMGLGIWARVLIPADRYFTNWAISQPWMHVCWRLKRYPCWKYRSSQCTTCN